MSQIEFIALYGQATTVDSLREKFNVSTISVCQTNQRRDIAFGNCVLEIGVYGI
jgi:hypothetical protein